MPLSLISVSNQKGQLQHWVSKRCCSSLSLFIFLSFVFSLLLLLLFASSSLIMTIASRPHAKATPVSERLGWLIDHSMLSCRHLCVRVGHQGHWFIFLVQWPSSFDRRQMNKQEVKEYVPARISMRTTSAACVCVWVSRWERRTHLIRVRIEMNERNDFFWHVCLLEKINMRFSSLFFSSSLLASSVISLSSIFESYQSEQKPYSLVAGQRVIRALNKSRREIYVYVRIFLSLLSVVFLSTSVPPP
jgi:hypothetical protein